jgi:hypothetical protein
MSNVRSKKSRLARRRCLQLTAIIIVAGCNSCERDPLDVCASGTTLQAASSDTLLEVGGRATVGASIKPTCFSINENVLFINDAPRVVSLLPKIGRTEVPVEAVGPGVALITAMNEANNALHSSVSIRVVWGEPYRIYIYRSHSEALRASESLVLDNKVVNRHDVVLSVPVTWTSDAPEIAEVFTDGRVLARRPGSARITATAGRVSESVQVVVEGMLDIVDRVEVIPASATVGVAQTVQLTARALDVSGNTIPGRSVTWQSDAPNVAAVSASGLVTGRLVGNTRVSASVDGKTGTSVVAVVLPGNGRFAYALADNPGAASYTVSGNSFNSANQPISIARSSPGEYLVQFSGMQPAAGQTQVFQVTAYGSDAVTCKIGNVSSNASSITAAVNCYTLADAPADQSFLILLLGSGAFPGRMAFGWADRPSSEDTYFTSSAYNANGYGVLVTRDDNGVYTVSFGGNERAAGGPAQLALVTATGATGSRCTVNSFVIDAHVHVHCVGGGSNYFVDDDAAFMTVMLEQGQPGRRFGFATITGQATLWPGESFSSSNGVITATRVSTGQTRVTFGGLGRTATNGAETVQVLARSEFGAFCKVVRWETVGADLTTTVQCLNHEGAAEDREFRILVMQ